MRRIDTASKPSASAMRIAVAAISSRVKRGRRGRARPGPESSALRCSASRRACRVCGLGRDLLAPSSRASRRPSACSARPARSTTFSATLSSSLGRDRASGCGPSVVAATFVCHSYSVLLSWSYYVRRSSTPYEQSPQRSRPPSVGTCRPPASASGSATSGPSGTSISTSPRARSSGCSATTAPARPPPSASSPRSRPPTEGTATRRGLSTSSPTPLAVRERIGVAAQQATVDGLMSARKNLVMVGASTTCRSATRERRADELLERLDLADAADRLVKTFSGGMRRRLDLAASLVAVPEVLFLDEPTTGLDPRSRDELWDMLRDLVRERHDDRPHDAVPRGGRPARRRHRRARPRPHGRARHARRAEDRASAPIASTSRSRSVAELDARRAARRGRSRSNAATFDDERSSPRSPSSKARASWTSCARSTQPASTPSTCNRREATLDDVFLTLTDARRAPSKRYPA